MAKKFAIMRGDKLKTGEMRGSIAHVTRSQNTPNADSTKRDLNYSIVGPAWDDPRAIQAAVEQQTPEKYRKDAVRLLEFVVTASPGWFADNPDKVEGYFEHAVEFYQREYGAENVVSAVVHRDETSPHMHLYVVPVDPEAGTLNAKKLFGGRGDMSRRQTAFANHMEDFGVERGRSNSARKHTEVRDWYAGHSKLDEREAALEQREAAVTSKNRDVMTAYEVVRKERSAAAFDKTQLADRHALLDERERQLKALERELSARGETLAGGEKALEQRQAEIDHAGSILRQKLDAARAAQSQFEQQKATWIAEHRPALPPLVQHLKHLETLGTVASAEYLEAQDGSELNDLFCPLDGLKQQGRALLEQYADVQKRAERFEQTFTPSSDAPGL